MNTPRPTRATDTRPRLIHWALALGLLSIPFVLAAVPTAVAVVIALSVAVASLVGYIALGRRA